MYGKGASGTGEWASWTAGWCRRMLPGVGGRGGAGTRWRWAVGWAGDTRDREERRLARSSAVLRCSSLATAAATPRSTARSRSGRSNMWDAFVWRMYLCWRHAGCTYSPRGHSLAAMEVGVEGVAKEWRVPSKTCQQIPAAPRLAFPLSLFSTRPYNVAPHHLSTAMPAIPRPHSPAQPLPAAEHASDSSTHAQADSPADTAHPGPPADQKVKKKRLGVDPSLIIAEGGRSKRRRTPSPEPDQKEQVNLDPKDSARAKELGMVIYEKIMDSKTKE